MLYQPANNVKKRSCYWLIIAVKQIGFQISRGHVTCKFSSSLVWMIAINFKCVQSQQYMSLWHETCYRCMQWKVDLHSHLTMLVNMSSVFTPTQLPGSLLDSSWVLFCCFPCHSTHFIGWVVLAYVFLTTLKALCDPMSAKAPLNSKPTNQPALWQVKRIRTIYIRQTRLIQ